MATTTTRKTTSTAKKKTSETNGNTALLEALAAKVNQLENEVAALQRRVDATPTSAPTSTGVTKEQLANALRGMGAREHVLSSAGLK